MYYDDQARRFNFISGLACGAVLGAGLAMVLAPQKEVRPARAWKGQASRGAERVRSALAGGGLMDVLAEAVAGVRERAEQSR